jgi:hypothetical protein
MNYQVMKNRAIHFAKQVWASKHGTAFGEGASSLVCHFSTACLQICNELYDDRDM